MKVVHLDKSNKGDLAAELKKIIAVKWDRRDREKAEKKYGKQQQKNRS